jgi:hypothetical protein
MEFLGYPNGISWLPIEQKNRISSGFFGCRNQVSNQESNQVSNQVYLSRAKKSKKVFHTPRKIVED